MADVFIEKNSYGNYIISYGGIKEQFVYFSKANALRQFRRKHGLVHKRLNIIEVK